MKLTYFLLLALMFPYWFPVVAFFFIVWVIGYPIACTAHQLYVRARYGRWVQWHLA